MREVRLGGYRMTAVRASWPVGVLSRTVPMYAPGSGGGRATPWAVAWTSTSVLPATAASDLAAADTDRVVTSHHRRI
jgi:hypothetical protein